MLRLNLLMSGNSSEEEAALLFAFMDADPVNFAILCENNTFIWTSEDDEFPEFCFCIKCGDMTIGIKNDKFGYTLFKDFFKVEDDEFRFLKCDTPTEEKQLEFLNSLTRGFEDANKMIRVGGNAGKGLFKSLIKNLLKSTVGDEPEKRELPSDGDGNADLQKRPKVLHDFTASMNLSVQAAYRV